MTRDEIPTPALLLDLDRFERNISKMAAWIAAAGKKLRPHSKTHKCPEIARRQIAAGAVGICCAKVGEAEKVPPSRRCQSRRHVRARRPAGRGVPSGSRRRR